MSYRALFALFALGLGTACAGPYLITVPSGPQPAKAQPISVSFPPPPAKVEEIALSALGPSNPCVWRDGYWDWTGRRWDWQPGRAVLPGAGCLYAEGKLAWSTDSLSFYRPAWYPDPARNPPPKSCVEVACIPIASSGTAAP